MGFFSSLFGGDQAKAAEKAAKIQANTARENKLLGEQYTADSLAGFDTALQEALGMANTAGQAYQPYADVGNQALSQLSNLYGLNGQEAAQGAMQDFQTTPGYDFRMSQGVNALDRSASARGGLYSGAAGKALTEYGQGVGSQEYGNYVGGLSGLMNTGFQGAQGLPNIALGQGDLIYGNAGNKANTRVGGLSAITGSNTQIGQAQAGGVLGAAAARAAGANNFVNLLTTGAKMAMGIPSFGGGGGGGGYVGSNGVPIPGVNPYFG